jgi:hypothetical protein
MLNGKMADPFDEGPAAQSYLNKVSTVVQEQHLLLCA